VIVPHLCDERELALIRCDGFIAQFSHLLVHIFVVLHDVRSIDVREYRMAKAITHENVILCEFQRNVARLDPDQRYFPDSYRHCGVQRRSKRASDKQ
jgi:hypothetical protein